MEETDLLGWVQVNGLFEQDNRNGTCPSYREPDTCPWVGWRMCVGCLSLCRTLWGCEFSLLTKWMPHFLRS